MARVAQRGDARARLPPTRTPRGMESRLGTRTAQSSARRCRPQPRTWPGHRRTLGLQPWLPFHRLAP
eukprot:11142826-Alexandrium_andersonii.AAC.1